MRSYSIDYTAPETFKLAAALPFYGQAEEVLRRTNPLWKAEIGEVRTWEVTLVKEVCGCNCPHCDADEHKIVEIEASTAKHARSLAELENDGWDAEEARVKRTPLDLPDDFYRSATEIYRRRHPGRLAS